MNKKIIISIFIATLFVTTLFAPAVLSDRRIKTDDVLLDKAEFTPTTKALTSNSLVTKQVTPKQIQSQDVLRAERTHRVSIPRPVLITPHNPTPSDVAVDVSLSNGRVYLRWHGEAPSSTRIRYELALGTSDTSLDTACYWETGASAGMGVSYNISDIADYCTTYYWQITAYELDEGHPTGVQVSGPVWSFTTDGCPEEPTIPQVTEAYSCASHNGVPDIKLPVDFENPFGVIDPRDQSRNLNTDENDRYIEVVFDSPVSCCNIDVSIFPELSGEVYIVQNSAPDTINIQFASRIPDGVYTISITSTSHSPSSFVLPPHTIDECFTISYLNGDVSGDGVVDTNDIGKIIHKSNWLRYLNDITQIPSLDPDNPACDINRDGVVSGLDIARVFNSANWEQSI